MHKYTTYILYLLITLLVAILAINDFGPMAGMQRSIDDFLCQFTASDETVNNVAIVTIDAPAQNTYGTWPWNQDRIADLLAAVATGEPKCLALDFVISEDARQDSAGYTDILAEQLNWIHNVVLPYDIALATFRSNKTNNPKYLFDYSVIVDNQLGLMSEEASLQVHKVFLPPEKILKTGPALGFDFTMPDEDRVIRHEGMLINYEGYYYPSVSLVAAAKYLDVPVGQIKVFEGDKIMIGSKRTLPINETSEFFVNFPKEGSFKTISAKKVLEEGFDLSQFKNKVVLIDVDDQATNQIYATPVMEQTPRSFVRASAIADIINNNYLSPKGNETALNLLILFIIGGIAAFVMPQVSMLYRLVMILGGYVVLANANYFLFSSFRIIPETVYIGLELLLFLIAAPFLDSHLLAREVASAKPTAKLDIPKPEARTKKQSYATATAESVPVRQLVDSPLDPENEKTTSLDQAQGRYPEDHQAINLDYGDKTTGADTIAPESKKLKTQAFSKSSTDSEPIIIGPGDDSGVDSGKLDIETPQLAQLDDSNPEIKAVPGTNIRNLGRYQIIGSLGKGAMGTVYKGIDPAINRPVALKTIRLDFVNDPEEMAELKERLFREAQAAGKLSHPNIVTIYDVGSEGHLQYIAMEYLEGQTLEDMIKKKVKFNYKIIAKIIIQVCYALEYAHDKGIVHRDIKPANIMVLKDYTVKLMDYGIARIDSNSMTKTGIAMGTPNYISPEQLKGMSVDKRADIFSLGVVIYEMLVGRRPFRGENITSLIYAIMNHEPEKPSHTNPQIPLLFDHIVGKALKKDPGERYQKASDLTADLFDFVESFAN